MVVEDIQLASANHHCPSAASKAWGIKAGFFYPAIDARDGDEAVPLAEIKTRRALDGQFLVAMLFDDLRERWHQILRPRDSPATGAAGRVCKENIGGSSSRQRIRAENLGGGEIVPRHSYP